MEDILLLLLNFISWLNQIVEFIKKWFGPFVE